MKKILLLIAICFCLAGCKDDKGTGTTEKYLHQIIINEDIYKSGQPTGETELYERYTYHPDGNLVELVTSYYNWADRHNHEYITYSYDSKNRVIEKVEKGSSYRRTTYVYNEIDSVETEKIFTQDGLLETIIYTYDENHKLTRKEQNTSTVSYYSTYSYEGNTITETTYYAKNHTIASLYNFEYDNQGHLIKIYPSNGVPIYRAEYEYDDNGRLTKQVKYNSIGDSECYTYNYDSEGKIIKVHYFSTAPIVGISPNMESDLIYTYIYAEK